MFNTIGSCENYVEEPRQNSAPSEFYVSDEGVVKCHFNATVNPKHLCSNDGVDEGSKRCDDQGQRSDECLEYPVGYQRVFQVERKVRAPARDDGRCDGHGIR